MLIQLVQYVRHFVRIHQVRIGVDQQLLANVDHRMLGVLQRMLVSYGAIAAATAKIMLNMRY